MADLDLHTNVAFGEKSDANTRPVLVLDPLRKHNVSSFRLIYLICKRLSAFAILDRKKKKK